MKYCDENNVFFYYNLEINKKFVGKDFFFWNTEEQF